MQSNSSSGQVISHVIAKNQGQSSSIGLTRVLPVVTTQTSLKQAIQVYLYLCFTLKFLFYAVVLIFSVYPY